MPVTVEQVTDGIYHVIVENTYDLAMTFCRAQEFYESSLTGIRGKKFDMTDFMRLYTQSRGDTVFSYPADWSGFNVPGPVLNKLYNEIGIDDFNTYDKLLLDIFEHVSNEVGSTNFYIIGSQNNDASTLNHEISHGLYFLNKKYKKDVNAVLEKLPKSIQNKIFKHLLETGYCKAVLIDELNAYLAHNLADISKMLKFSKKDLKSLKKISAQLQEIYTSFIDK